MESNTAIAPIANEYEDEADAGNDWQSNLGILAEKVDYYKEKKKELDEQLSNPVPSYRETKYDNQQDKIANLQKIIDNAANEAIATAESILPIDVWTKNFNAGDKAGTMVKLELLIGVSQAPEDDEIDITTDR